MLELDMSEISKALQMADDVNEYQISILGLSKTRCNGQGKIREGIIQVTEKIKMKKREERKELKV